MTAYIAQKLRDNEREIAILRDLLEEEKQAMKGHIDGRTAAEQERDHLRETNAELLAALKDENALIEKAQDYLRMYLEPGERRIQTNAECVNALLRLLDGPEQREAQGNARAAIARAEGEDR